MFILFIVITFINNIFNISQAIPKICVSGNIGLDSSAR